MQTLLLCPPDHYAIQYEINPWMDRSRGADPELARAQWQGLRDKLLELGFHVELIDPQPGLPDMVFTANAGLVAGRQFIASNFRFQERRGEEPHFQQWFAGHGYEVIHLPPELFFEGEGDALFCGDTLFCGYRFRSDVRSHNWLGQRMKCLVISVELVEDRFYHLDTCFCPLPDGGAIWYPGAFDDYGRRAIRGHVPDLIEVAQEEALQFACNAVPSGSDIVMPQGCPDLSLKLARRGWRPHTLAMTEFLKAGGACKCLALRLPGARQICSDAPPDCAA